MLLILEPPSGNQRGPEATEQLLRTLHRIAVGEPIELQLRSEKGQSFLAINAPDELATLISGELYSAYPGLRIRKRKPTRSCRRVTTRTHLRLVSDRHLIRPYEDFADTDGTFIDPMLGVLSAMKSGRAGSVEYTVRLEIRPPRRKRQVGRWLWRLAFQPFGPGSSEHADKLDQPLFHCRLSLEAHHLTDASSAARRNLRGIVATYGRFNGPRAQFARCSNWSRWFRQRFLLSSAEVATLWHLPTETTDHVERVARPALRELAPPISLPSRKGSTDATILGRTVYHGRSEDVCIPLDDLRRHLIALGTTGCGKSVFLTNVARQQIEAGRGVVLIDPHGQLADAVLETIPSRRTNDVVVLDAADTTRPVVFNPLQSSWCAPSLLADGIVTSFSRVFGFDPGSAPRLLHIFRNSLLTLIGRPGVSLLSIQRLLTDSPYRNSMVSRLNNDVVLSFWKEEFDRWTSRDRVQYIASLQNKLGAFLTNPQLNAILAGQGPSLDLRNILDSSGVLICNLSKGTLGHEASTLLGSLLLSSLHVAAMSRADIAEDVRTDSVVLVDEFHSYLAEGNTTMADAMSESRKYRVSYVLATQFLEQLDAGTRASVLGNCGSVLTMRVGPGDASILCELLGNDLQPENLVLLPRFRGYLRLLLHGTPHTFSMATLPPPPAVGRADVIRRVSRDRYGVLL